jgi:hypothetical protein
MKKLLIAFLIVLTLASCGKYDYSPLDSYVKASVESHEANIKARAEAQSFIDSINCK